MRTSLPANSTEEVARALNTALTHLYDPGYAAPALLTHVLNPLSGADGDGWRAALLAAITAMQPPADAPPHAPARRLHEVLHCRYVEGKTQEEAAYRLGVTPRHLRRLQQQAIHALAYRLAPGGQPVAVGKEQPAAPAAEGENQAVGEGSAGLPARLVQIRNELDALRRTDPSGTAEIGVVVAAAVRAGRVVAARHDVAVQAAATPGGLQAAIHPSVLREMLIAAVIKLAERMQGGEVQLAAEAAGDRMVLSVAGAPLPGDPPEHSLFLQEAAAAYGGRMHVTSVAGRTEYRFDLPAVAKLKVLVVEDNPDLVHFYRRYTSGTRYEVVHAPTTTRILETAAELRPAVIVLDIMLPNVDGWEVLNQLHEQPETGDIPVIVCSVVRQAELSLALGAAAYVQKPVGLSEFLEALDRAVDLGPTGRPA